MDTATEMNKLTKLHRLFHGTVVWDYESSGPVHESMFTATATIQGQQYSGTSELSPQCYIILSHNNIRPML